MNFLKNISLVKKITLAGNKNDSPEIHRAKSTAHNSTSTIHRGTIHRSQFTAPNSPRTVHRA
jgi:hypothetical protein